MTFESRQYPTRWPEKYRRSCCGWTILKNIRTHREEDIGLWSVKQRLQTRIPTKFHNFLGEVICENRSALSQAFCVFVRKKSHNIQP
jgi:hypothetical protein